jgi:BlaI family penicillinase repressor
VRSIVDKFCSGSLESLLLGLVDDKQISPDRLRELADQIASAEAAQENKASTGRGAARQ